MKVKQRLPVSSIATSGRWNKRPDGEWGFDFDEPTTKHDEESGEAGSEEENAESALNDQQQSESNPNVDQTLKKAPITIPDKTTTSSSSQQAKSSNTNQETITNPSVNVTNQELIVPPIHLVLRMRDEKKELQDIKFDFLPNKDTVEEISNELVNAKLIDAIDMVIVSTNLNKLLENHSISPITFPLVNYY